MAPDSKPESPSAPAPGQPWRLDGEAHLRLLLENLGHPMGLFEPGGRLILLNRPAAQLLGRRPAELVGKNLAQLFAKRGPQYLQRLTETFRDAKATTYLDEVTVGGVRRWLSTNYQPFYQEPHGFEAVQVISQDITGIKETETKLASAREHYRLLAEGYINPVVFFNASGEVLMLNSTAATTFGGTVESCLGRSLGELLPQGLSLYLGRLKRVIDNGVEEFHEEQVILGNGRKRWFRSVLTPVPGPGGLAQAVQVVSQDITSIRQTQRELADSEKRYHLLADHLDEVLFQIDANMSFTYFSPSVQRLLGYTPQEMLGLSLDQWLDDASVQIVEAAMQQRLDQEIKGVRDDTSQLWLTRHRCKNGSWLWLENTISPLRDELGRFAGYIGVMRDISRRKAAEDALAARQRQLNAVVENAPLILWSTDRKGMVTLARGKGLELLPKEHRSWVGKNVLKDFAGSPGLAHGARSALAGESVVAISQMAGRRLETSHTPLHDEAGRVRGIMAVSTDITERELARRQQAKLEFQLRQSQKMEAVGTLAGGIAHDFNNIMTSIMGYGQMALEALAHGGDASSDIQSALKSGEQACSLVGQLLSFSRRTEASMEPLDLNQRINETMAILGRALSKTVDIRTVLATDLWPVRGNANQLDQVLINLCTNAADAMSPGGGLLLLKTANLTLEGGKGSANPPAGPGRYVSLTVKDTGCGMDEDTLSRVFDPFFTTKDTGKGTGLGLSIVQGIIKSHLGHTWVQSRPGQGACFSILLPALPEARPEPELAAAGELELSGGDETILVVDDEEAMLNMVEHLLSRAGYQVVTAPNGLQGLERFKRGGIDLVILDLNMPQLSGERCLAEMLVANPKARVLVFSGYTEYVNPADLLAAGALGLIKKPFQKSELLGAVRKALGPKKPAAA